MDASSSTKAYKDLEALLLKQKQEFELELSKRIEELKLMHQKNIEQEEEIKKLNEQIEELQIQCRYKPQKIEILDEEEIENLEKIDKLGEGEGGKVYKVFKKVPYVLKVIKFNSQNPENLQNFLNEQITMNLMNHPNILKSFGMFNGSNKKRPSILIEHCPSNLDTAIKKNLLTKVKCLFTIYQIAEGMKCAHFQKVVHRNLKPTNILIQIDGTIKICDFGISKLMKSDEQLITRGTVSQKFMAPEIVKEEGDSNYNEKVDVYSFGVLIYFILNKGEMPAFNSEDACAGKMPELPPSFTPFGKNLINSCWCLNPDERPSFNVILEKLERNNYKLVETTKSEIKELLAHIEQHKEKLPKYDE